MTKKKLIIINIILLVLLISIALRENYHTRVLNKFKHKEINDSELKNPTLLGNFYYQQEIDLYQYYQKKGKIVMLGNSMIYRADWNELLNREDIINRGIGNDTTAGFLARMEHIINVEPELCFIMGGTNDIGRDKTPEEISINLSTVVDELQKNSIKPIIFSILYVAKKYPNYKAYNKLVKQTNNKLQKMCLNKKIRFVNLNSSLSKNEILKEAYSSDDIHLTGLGYSKWSEIITPIIEQEISNTK